MSDDGKGRTRLTDKQLQSRYKEMAYDRNRWKQVEPGYIDRPPHPAVFDLESMSMPVSLVRSTLDNFQGSVKDVAYAAIEEGKGLLIQGEFRSGKSHIAVGMMKEMFRRDLCYEYFFVDSEVLFSKARALLTGNRGKPKHEQHNTDEIFVPVRQAEFLALDNLGSRQLSNWGQNQMATILRHRLSDGLFTVLTTSHNDEQLIEQIGSTCFGLVQDLVYASVSTRKEDSPKVGYRYVFAGAGDEARVH